MIGLALVIIAAAWYLGMKLDAIYVTLSKLELASREKNR
jgi:hypothetical protein